MKFIILSFFVLFAGCSRIPKLNDKVEFMAESHKAPLRVVKRQFWEVKEAGDVLRNTSSGAISIWVRQTGELQDPQSIISISVGSKKANRRASRASIKIFPEGRLFAEARAHDLGAEQNIMTGPILKKGTWHHVFLNIDYARDQMTFYVDGVMVPSRGVVNFKAKKTSNTASHAVILGAEDDGGAAYFKGQLKDVAVWKRTLSEENIRAVWKGIKPEDKIMIGL